MENQKPFTPNGNFDALMRIYKGEVPPTQGVAIATDAGTSEGVKKSWLKRERAKQDADVDTLDKGKSGIESKDIEEAKKALVKIYADSHVKDWKAKGISGAGTRKFFTDEAKSYLSFVFGEREDAENVANELLEPLKKSGMYSDSLPIVKAMSSHVAVAKQREDFMEKKRNERAVAAKPIRDEIEKEGGKMPTKDDVDRLLIELGKSNAGGKGEWSHWQVMKVLHALSKNMK